MPFKVLRREVDILIVVYQLLLILILMNSYQLKQIIPRLTQIITVFRFLFL